MKRKPLDLRPGRDNLKIRAARIYSDIFSPPSLYAIFAFIVAWSSLPFWKGFIHASIFAILTSLFPILFILIQMKRGILSDIHLSQSGERKIPYVLSFAGASIAYLGLRYYGSSTLFLNFMLTIVIGLAALALINLKWLISAHTASITAITAFSGFAFDIWLALVLSPLVLFTMYIRFFLKRHTLGELISGFFLGIVVVVGTAVFWYFRD